MTAIGITWKAALVSDQRGPLVTRKADTREAAFAQAHRLLDEAQDREWFRGEVVGVQIGRADQ